MIDSQMNNAKALEVLYTTLEVLTTHVTRVEKIAEERLNQCSKLDAEVFKLRMQNQDLKKQIEDDHQNRIGETTR